jgi:hypothetical protein
MHYGTDTTILTDFSLPSVVNQLLYRVLVGKPEGKRPLGKPRRRWEDNINLQEVGCGSMDWIELAQDRQVAGTCECGNEPSGSIKCGEFLD